MTRFARGAKWNAETESWGRDPEAFVSPYEALKKCYGPPSQTERTGRSDRWTWLVQLGGCDYYFVDGNHEPGS